MQKIYNLLKNKEYIPIVYNVRSIKNTAQPYVYRIKNF